MLSCCYTVSHDVLKVPILVLEHAMHTISVGHLQGMAALAQQFRHSRSYDSRNDTRTKQAARTTKIFCTMRGV